MKNILLQQLENALPEGMQIPEELRQLYQWIEDNGYYMDAKGVRYGWLFPEDKIIALLLFLHIHSFLFH